MKKKSIKISFIIIITLVTLFFAIIFIRPTLANDKYEVVFYSDTEKVLSVEQVSRNETPVPPNNPQMNYGRIFQKWDTDFTLVKKDLKIHPESISFIGKENVFALPGAYGKHGDTVVVPLILCGNVCLSGFDISVSYDNTVLELESVFNEDGAIIYNKEIDGIVRINYASVNNTIADVDICSFKFKIKQEVEQTDLSINIESICANNNDETFHEPKFTVINSSIYVLPNKGGAFFD